MSIDHDKGAVRILCDEIGFPFDRRLERKEVLIAFVRELVEEVEDKRLMTGKIAHVLAHKPSEASLEVLALAKTMIADGTVESAAAVHDAAHPLNPEDAYPTDHYIDVLSSCASAVRFGQEMPCHSRHAASAAQHVWKFLYGVSRFDGYTPAWEKDWACKIMQRALIALATDAFSKAEGHTP